MEKTWASGALELLRHADSHMELDSAFDARIAFISIDNCVETCVRTFLTLPKSRSKIDVKRAEVDEAGNSFPKLIDLLFKHVRDRLTGVDRDDVEHYHRIRNQLYHDGTGLGVDEQYLSAYRSIATLLLEKLFDIEYSREKDEKLRLDTLILDWNMIELEVKRRFAVANIDSAYTYKWEEAMQAGVLTMNQIRELTELRIARNRLVHSISINPLDVAHWAKKAKEFLRDLRSAQLK